MPSETRQLLFFWSRALCTLLLFDVVAMLDIRACRDALGVESGRVTDAQLSASSAFDQLSTGPAHARIRSETGGGAWCPATQIDAGAREWLQVDLGAPHLISAVETQGRWDGGRGREFAGAFMLEYWRDSLGRWARYRDAQANEIIDGNSDTRTAVMHALDGCIIARLVRIIPVSETTRTVCMRFELYGCAYQEHLSSYSMEDGVQFDGLDLRDTAYDGASAPLGSGGSAAIWLSGGLGRLFDGVVGADNFEMRPEGWVGWRRLNVDSSLRESRRVTLDFQLSSRQNLSAILFHTSNFRRLGARVFANARLYFATNAANDSNAADFSPRFIDFDNIVSGNENSADTSARWVRIAIAPARVASRVRVVLDFADNAQWLLLSEFRFEYGAPVLDAAWPADRPWHGISNESTRTYFTVVEQDGGLSADGVLPFDSRCFLVGVLFLGAIAVSIATVSVFYCIIMVYRRNVQLEKVTHISNLPNSKSLMQIIFQDSKCSTKLSKPFDHKRDCRRKLADKFSPETPDADVLKSSFSSSFSTSTGYAEPELLDICLAQPLLAQQCATTLCRMKHERPHCGGTSASCYDLMCRSVVSTGSTTVGSVRYRATPCASTFDCATTVQQRSGSAETTRRCDVTDEEDAYALSEDYASAGPVAGEVSTPTTLVDDCADVVLPNFETSALHTVQRLGVTAAGHSMEVFRMDADRLVSVISPTDEEATKDSGSWTLRDEIRRLSQLRHFNVLRIIGTVSNPGPAYVIEFMPNGNIYQFLKNRTSAINDEMLISFATQIAAGMAYLETRGFIHGSLMARNCLINTEGSVKVGFEPLRVHNDEIDGEIFTDPIRDRRQRHVPIRWCAWEILVNSAYSTSADVWSFGVTMWELFSECLERPYTHLSDSQIVHNAHRFANTYHSNDSVYPMVLAIPKRCSQFLYDQLMLTCWRANSKKRPSFTELHRILQNLALSNIAQKMLNSRNLVEN